MFFVVLFLLFVFVPLAELTLLLIIAELAGHWWVSLLIVILTGILGATLARHQGAAAWRQLAGEVRAGRLPTDAILDAVLILIAGAFLLTPGVLTDFVGVSLLIPVSRKLYRVRIKRWVASRFQIEVGTMDSFRSQVVDSYVVDHEGKTVETPVKPEQSEIPGRSGTPE